VRSGDKARVQNVISFRHPAGPPDLPSPKDRVAGLLPVVAGPPAYGVEMSNAGGFAVRIGSHAYPVESSFTYPHGGENRLTVAGAPHAGGEREWQVRVEKFEGSAYRVVGSGRHYRITREIIPQPTRVLVKDRIENLTGADLGLALDNRIDAKGHAGVALKALAAPVPPVFVQAHNHGIGLVPLDDVYQFIQATYTEDHAGGSRIAGLGIAKGSSHTLEWAVYPIASADYYDLVNAIRRDEGLNGLTVDGCLAMSHSGVWGRCAPPEELVKFGGIKYASSGGLMKVADDPKLSFQGIEFVNYPKEREALRKTYAATKARFPGLQSGFHVAYNIYVTDQPGRLYSDSLMLAASGKHEMYANPAQYIGEPRRSDGWAFYPYYPTMSNSFGKDFLRSGDLMMDDIGVGMVWADGLLSGYAAGMGDFPTGFVRTLDPWDGFSVELDPATKTILRKWGIAAALGKDVLVEYIHRINVKGGRVWINHMTTVPRSFARQTAYWAAETNDGDARCASLHLSPAPHGLANPVRWRTTQMIYDDIRAKLQWGSLYVYYWGPGGASQLPHRMITAEMTPITIEEIRAGCIKGRERIVTLNPGVYGWPQDHHLHAIRLFDARGRTTTHAFHSTADQAGTRTQLDLAAGETAVLVRLPFIIQAGDAVNFCVTRYEDGLLELTLRGQGNVTLRLEEQTPGSLSLNGGAGEIGADRRTVHLRLEGAAQLLIEVDKRR
jgi:hypothetical protein